MDSTVISIHFIPTTIQCNLNAKTSQLGRRPSPAFDLALQTFPSQIRPQTSFLHSLVHNYPQHNEFRPQRKPERGPSFIPIVDKFTRISLFCKAIPSPQSRLLQHNILPVCCTEPPPRALLFKFHGQIEYTKGVAGCVVKLGKYKSCPPTQSLNGSHINVTTKVVGNPLRQRFSYLFRCPTCQTIPGLISELSN